MKTGWYLSGQEAWYWCGKNRKFTDHLDQNAVQYSCVVRHWSQEQIDEMEEAFRLAKTQLGNLFNIVSGPHTFEEICDGRRLV